MKKSERVLVILIAAIGLALQPALLLAAEHGGQEHGGTTVKEPMKGQGSVSMPSMPEENTMVWTATEKAAVLREAADALQVSRPDLAEKLNQLAAMEGQE